MTTYTKPLAMTGTGILALALLTGCATTEQEGGAAGDDAATPAATATVTTTASPTTGGDATNDQATSTATGTSTGTATGTAATGTNTATPTGTNTATASPTDGQTTGTAAAAGDDPAFAAIDALYAQHQDAIIVEIDRDDRESAYEIEAVVDDTIMDFDVTTDGQVREDDDTDDDDDDIRKARQATVPAEEAATAALEGREAQTIDSMELDDEDGMLRWEIELDRENGDDGDELIVDAMTGEVRTD